MIGCHFLTITVYRCLEMCLFFLVAILIEPVKLHYTELMKNGKHFKSEQCSGFKSPFLHNFCTSQNHLNRRCLFHNDKCDSLWIVCGQSGNQTWESCLQVRSIRESNLRILLASQINLGIKPENQMLYQLS